MTEVPLPKRYGPDAMERKVLERWRGEGTFMAQVEAGRRRYEESDRDPAHKFVFLEGPPTANGMPHPGHVLTRTLKDAVCRYHAMLGKWVPRKAGWDCHGLPVEIEVQKELGIEHVSEIEAYGVEAFNAKCRESVFRYQKEWETMSERVGFWLDYDDPYVTMDDAYIESVWWSLKRFFDAGLLVKSHKVVPYCPQTGTTYSSHEVAQGYKDVVDTSVYAAFRLVDDPDGAKILSWTTTPWTLPGNVALAVGDDVEYVKVRVTEASGKTGAAAGDVLVLAKPLVKEALRDRVEVVQELKGRDLVGLRYEPLFPGAVDLATAANAASLGADAGDDVGPPDAWKVVAADFVTTEDGTGIVHTAVMYGEDDYHLGIREGLPAEHTVDLEGRFVERVPAGLAGRAVKDPETEARILEHLRENGALYRDEPYPHAYPHCWRTGAPLLYYAIDSWYVRMGSLRDRLLEANNAIHWVPGSIRDGRMGDWLRNVKDWAFSRKRYWGTPLPVWVCDRAECGAHWCAGSRADLEGQGLKVQELHRPYVDATFPCRTCGEGTMVREPYVIDVWYDSGAAHFAQWGARSDDDERLVEHWPIDFIAEGLDQTRGWFYSLLASGVALRAALGPPKREVKGVTPKPGQAFPFDGPSYRNVVVNGLILADDGQKMSKSKRNYMSPDKVFAEQGADATRWYLLSTAPWQDKRFTADAVREAYGRFFTTLWNTFLFHHQYAALDGWRPDLKTLDTLQSLTEETPLDRWLLSRLEATVAQAREAADRFHLHKAVRAVEAFVIDDLSNWWVRRSRDRFWQEAQSPDKRSAHAVLWWSLHSVCRLVAPFAPFMVEHIWDRVRLPEDPESVHLAAYPEAGGRDEALEAAMGHVRRLAEAGRALRSRVGIPTRHPLARALVVGEPLGALEGLLREELNVKRLETVRSVAEAQRFVACPERAALGPDFKQHAPKVAEAIGSLDGDAAHETLEREGRLQVRVEGQEHVLEPRHVRFEREDRDGWATAQVDAAVLALCTERDAALQAEAFAREVIRRVQELRKEMDLELEERVDLRIACSGAARRRLGAFRDMVAREVRASSLDLSEELPAGARSWDVDGEPVACLMDPEGSLGARHTAQAA